jgi:hypothetical protein
MSEFLWMGTIRTMKNGLEIYPQTSEEGAQTLEISLKM